MNLPESLTLPSKKKGKLVYTEPSVIFQFQSQLQQGQEPNNRLKLMILGRNNVGKTTVLNALTAKKKSLLTALTKSNSGSTLDLSTDGVDIRKFLIPRIFSENFRIFQH